MAPTPARGYLQEGGETPRWPHGSWTRRKFAMYTGERRGPGRSTGHPPQHAASCRGGSNFGDCQRWGGPFPLLRAMKVLATPSRRPQATLLHAAGQGSSEHRAPHGRKPSDRPSRGSPGRGKAPCPRPALPKGPWAPRAEGDRQGGSKAWCQPGQGGGEIPKKRGLGETPGPLSNLPPSRSPR